jgi:hypothetical protein
MKNFFDLVWRCSTSLSVYRELSTKRFGQGLAYLYFLLVVTTLVTALPILVSILGFKGQAAGIAEALKQEALEFYPSELEVVIENGELRANVAQPYNIPMPKKMQEMIDADPPSSDARFRNIRHLIEIDTNAQVDDYEERGALVLITKHNLIFPDKKEGFRVRSFSPSDNFTLNKSVYDSYLPVAVKWIDWIPWLVLVGGPILVLSWVFVGPCFSIFVYLGYLLLTSVFLLVLAAVMRSKLSYGRIFSTSLYGLTLPIVFSTIWGIFGTMPTFFFSLIFLAFMSVVIVRESKQPPANS